VEPPLVGLAIVPREVGEVVQKQPAEPGEQLGLGVAAESGEVPLGFEERLLDQIRRPALGLQRRVEFPVGDPEQVQPAGFEGFPERLRRAVPRRRQLPREEVAGIGHPYPQARGRGEWASKSHWRIILTLGGIYKPGWCGHRGESEEVIHFSAARPPAPRASAIGAGSSGLSRREPASWSSTRRI